MTEATAATIERWQGNYRSVAIAKGQCGLCSRVEIECLTFSDNEGVGFEKVCRICLQVAMEMIEAKRESM